MTLRFVEGRHAAEFILSEANGSRSRGEAWVAPSALVTTAATALTALNAANTALSASPADAGLQAAAAAALVTYNNAADALAADPTNVIRSGEILQVVPAAGDVPANYKPIAVGTPAGAVALAIYPLVLTADDPNGQSIAILCRDAEVNGHLIQWPIGITDPNMVLAIAALAEVGIIVR